MKFSASSILYINKLANIMRRMASSFSRGILVRKNSSYNQDLASNIILIELGSQDNTIEEVNNTIGVLANALSSYINE